MSRQIVVWSGGADSTYLLHWYAMHSSIQNPVHAMTVDSYPQLSSVFMNAQRLARNRYLKFAEKSGLHIVTHVINSECDDKTSVGIGENVSAQPIMWLCSIMPFIHDGDIVCFSYIRDDGIWHVKKEFEDVFYSICRLKGISAELKFPIEGNRKFQILNWLSEYKITDKMWWSCESPKNKKPCGVCYKCCEIEISKIKWDMEIRNPYSPFYEGEVI